MRPSRALLLIVGVSVAIAACSSGSAHGDRPGTTTGPVTGVGPGISVEEAQQSGGDTPVLVNGYLIVSADGEVILASGLAESLPPQSAGITIAVEGIDLDEYRLSEAQGVRWTDETVQVLGVVEGDTLVVTPTLSG